MPNKKFKFIDLFAGIGGFHIAMHRLGGECVFASEMDSDARKTYQHNFEKTSPKLFSEGHFNDDIRSVSPEDIPDFDVLCAGFPCQPFSQAGHKRGFKDNHSSERGNLFFYIAEILSVKQPKAFFLENVRGLVNHDNGKTFKIIRDILTNELGYSFNYKVVKATDYGLPQHRPRVFIVGYKNEGYMSAFSFPEKRPLKFNMSQVWGGFCSREIGLTLRVGGKGSPIDDRRNWDGYIVDGAVRRISPKEGKMMQGFPEDFEFPVSKTAAVKQLGNSVAIDAVQAVGQNLLTYMNHLFSTDKIINEKKKMIRKFNIGEWSELLVFLRLLSEGNLKLADGHLNPLKEAFIVGMVTSKHISQEYRILSGGKLEIRNKESSEVMNVDVSTLISLNSLDEIKNRIIQGSKEKTGTFTLPEIEKINESLRIDKFKGGNSKEKADIYLDIRNEHLARENEPFGIKSYLGSNPTLFNSSGSTNFIYRVNGLSVGVMDEINSITGYKKLIKRVESVITLGGDFEYIKPEKSTLDYNLTLVDSHMSHIVGAMLLSFFRDRKTKIIDIVNHIDEIGELKSEIGYKSKEALIIAIKRLLMDNLLGIFPTEKWDGEYQSKGTIVLKASGDIVGYHIVDMKHLKDYLFNHCYLDTPSSSRHQFGKLYKEKDNKLYYKYNLQIRI